MVLSAVVMTARLLLALLLLPFCSRLSMQLKILALRHQLRVLQRSGPEPESK